jgi:hypothetical protein
VFADPADDGTTDGGGAEEGHGPEGHDAATHLGALASWRVTLPRAVKVIEKKPTRTRADHRQGKCGGGGGEEDGDAETEGGEDEHRGCVLAAAGGDETADDGTGSLREGEAAKRGRLTR